MKMNKNEQLNQKAELSSKTINPNTPLPIMSYVRLIACIILWGGIYHVAKYLVDEDDIYTISFSRFLLSAIILLVLFIANKRNAKANNCKKFEVSRKQLLMLFYVGFVGIFCYSLFFFSAENNIPAVTVAILYAFTPCITVLLNRLCFQSKLSTNAYFGIILAFAGTIIVILSSTHNNNQSHLVCSAVVDRTWGIVAAVLASISMAIYSILNRRAALMDIEPLTITTFSVVFGAILLFVAFMFFGAPVKSLFHHGWKFWGAMFYMVVLGTVLCYKWYSDAIKHIGVGKTAVFLNGVPLSAVIIGVLLGESLNIFCLAGGFAIIVGVIITNLAVNHR